MIASTRTQEQQIRKTKNQENWGSQYLDQMQQESTLVRKKITLLYRQTGDSQFVLLGHLLLI
jgi:hypothetical protein